MCLHVTKVVNVPIRKCKKNLTYNSGIFFTPFQGTKVPNNGWLVPGYKSNVPFAEGVNIEGGFIHAYIPQSYMKNSPYYDAYAIQVKAYDISESCSGGELVCRAMYIPKADKDVARRNATIKFLDTRPASRLIVTKFPFILPYLNITYS